MKKIILSILVSIILTVSLSLPVYAISDPDSITFHVVRVFQNIFEDGDQVYLARYDVEYGSAPDEEAEDTFIFVLYDTDGTTLLFQRALNYYGHNLISIYLDSSQALTWDTAYVLRIMGNPAIFPTLTEGVNRISRTLGAQDYDDGDEDTSRSLLGTYIVDSCQTIENDTSEDLVSDSNLLTVLGATYVNAAIPGLSSVIPWIYLTAVSMPELDEVAKTVTLVGAITGTFTSGEICTGGTSAVTGTFIAGSQQTSSIQISITGVSLYQNGETATGQISSAEIVVSGITVGALEWQSLGRTGARLRNALDNFGDWLGISGNALGGLLIFLLFVISAGFIFVRTGQVAGAVLISFPLILLGNFLGIFSFAIVWMVTIVVVLLFGILFIMGKMG